MQKRIISVTGYRTGNWSVAAVARRHGLSRKATYKWIRRYDSEQWDGLKDRSRAPKTQSRAIGDEIIEQIVAVKRQCPQWGAPRIHRELTQLLAEQACPSVSTVSNILQRLGLTRPYQTPPPVHPRHSFHRTGRGQ